MQMSKNIVAVLAVTTILVVSAIGVGLAYQAAFTDQTSTQSAANGQYLRVADGTDPVSLNTAHIPMSPTTYYLNAGIDINNSTGTPAYYWDLTDAKVTTDNKGKQADVLNISEVSAQAADQPTATVKALFYVGAYAITSPQAITDATVSVVTTTGSTPAGLTIYTILTTENLSALPAAANVTQLNNQSLSPEATTYYVFVMAVWTVGSPTGSTGSVVESQLTLPTVSVKVTATAEDFE